jgi:hypothetical protein
VRGLLVGRGRNTLPVGFRAITIIALRIPRQPTTTTSP